MAAPATGQTELAVNVAGFLRGALGLGEAARLYVAALRAAGVPVSTTVVDVPLPDIGDGAVKKVAEFVESEEARQAPFNLVCVNAPELPAFYEDVGKRFFRGRRSIGVWAWEVDKVPDDWRWAFDLFDEIWTYSSYVERIIGQVSPVPVARVPLPVPAQDPDAPRPSLGLPDRFTFLFLFDFFSTMERKNPLGLIEAFRRAFAPGEAQLVLKSFNGDYKPERLRKVEEAASAHPDVHVVDRYLSSAEKNGLMAGCDCYVSLHRAEGFGLTLAEAMALGKPVVATGFSGNTDFMTEDNSYLVRYGLREVGSGAENYPREGTWADPDLDHAAELMRRVFDDRKEALARAAAGRQTVLEQLSTERVGEIARSRLEALAEDREGGRTTLPPVPSAAHKPLRWAQGKVEFDPDRWAANIGGAKGFAQRLTLRAMRPYTYHQEELNQALVEAVEKLTLDVDRIRWLMEREAGLDDQGMQDLRRLLEATRTRPSPGHPWISYEDEEGRTVLGFRRDGEAEERLEASAGLEEVFGGDGEATRRRQAVYVELFGAVDRVLDLGSGRAEFLDLLREHGIQANRVERAEALEHLRGLEDAGTPAIFSAHLVEHLPPDALVEALAQIEAKLVPGGTAVVETVNPHLPAALKAFWTDPTHHHPLFPEVLVALSRFAGFGAARVLFPEGTGDPDVDLYSCPDYAVVLEKASTNAGR
jgi:glycosyltransferase involved in cell wall biosynthesis